MRIICCIKTHANIYFMFIISMWAQCIEIHSQKYSCNSNKQANKKKKPLHSNTASCKSGSWVYFLAQVAFFFPQTALQWWLKANPMWQFYLDAERKKNLSQLNAIDNTQRGAAVRTAQQSTSSLIYGGDLVYHGKEALEVDLQHSTPPFHLSC